MSYQLLKTDILYYQRILKASGFYTKKLDGIWGSGTDAADKAFIEQGKIIAAQHGTFDPRSESNIIALVPKAQVLSRKFLSEFKKVRKDVRIISGTRTYAEQDSLYRIGRFGSKLPKVTNARGGQSNHNFGVAWDIGLFENGKYIATSNKYRQLFPLVQPLSHLVWGGNWIDFIDFPHYQHETLFDNIVKIRNAFEAGNVYV